MPGIGFIDIGLYWMYHMSMNNLLKDQRHVLLCDPEGLGAYGCYRDRIASIADHHINQVTQMEN